MISETRGKNRILFISDTPAERLREKREELKGEYETERPLTGFNIHNEAKERKWGEGRAKLGACLNQESGARRDAKFCVSTRAISEMNHEQLRLSIHGLVRRRSG